jgi:hypothetical protein
MEKLKLSGMAFYRNARKAFGERILPRKVSVGVQLLRLSMDLTDFVREVWIEESENEFDERLKEIQVEYREVEREMLLLTDEETDAYCIECARLCTQLREIGGTGMSEDSEEDSEEESKDEENYLEEKLVRKVPLGHVDGRVHGEECLGCEEMEALDKYYDEHGEKCTCEAC